MEILIFVSGAVFGAVIVFLATKIADKTANTQAQKLQTEMQLYFENIANKALRENSSELNNSHKEKLSELLAPFKEQIEKFEKKVEENMFKETEQFSKLDAGIKYVLETGNKLSQDTNKLSTVLKGDTKTQGRWGELVLERILEFSGLRLGEEYLTQKSFDENTKKPDVVILLGENRCIYIDAKTSLAPYDDYLNAQTPEEKSTALKAFQESVKTHISKLSQKEYFSASNYSSPEYVLMFIPIESCYNLLFAEDAKLWELAWKSKIMPVSPTNLLAALKIINAFHTINRQNKNAQEIAEIAGKMINKFAAMCQDVRKIDDALESIKTKLSGKDNIIKNIEKMQELGAKSTKQIPEIKLPEEN